MTASNQNPEQLARDVIDAQLDAAGWQVQSKKAMNVLAAPGVAVRELQTQVGPGDYFLFADGDAAGVIEAKRAEEGQRLTTVEGQTDDYRTSLIKGLNNEPLRFGYEATGTLTRFTDYSDPKPRSRLVFGFHQPETLLEWMSQDRTLRARLHDIPSLEPDGLRECQFNAIRNLEESFRDAKPRALIQMATGAGKTFTAITSVYRLLKHANAKRILFLVDTRNLGEQAEQEFLRFQPRDDNRKFTDLYKVQRLAGRHIAPDAKVCISTIQRMYSILKGEELAGQDEDTNPAERNLSKPPPDVEYNADVPPEMFDFVVIDECHRSIYNLWKQVLEYFDAFQIGLTATPDKRTFGYFRQNVVSEYPYEQSILDGVNVGFDIFRIETEVTSNGGVIKKDDGFVEVREKLTREQRWQQIDDDIEYDSNRLNRDVVNKSQIRTVIQEFHRVLPQLFKGREKPDGTFEVPKTLIFAKDDSHAEDIVQIVREEFGEGNEFCKKITSKSDEDPKGLLADFRNSYNLRVAVTVDMIATGTDVKPLECLLFMRDVRSRGYFEQMKGRGCRSIPTDDLLKVTPTARNGKASFIIVDAVGVTKTCKTDSRPLERKRGESLANLLHSVALGNYNEDTYLSVANRLTRLNHQLTEEQKREFETLSGQPLEVVCSALISAHDADAVEAKARADGAIPADQPVSQEQEKAARKSLAKDAARLLTPEAREFVINARKALDQMLDPNIDRVLAAEWDTESIDNARQIIRDFRTYIEARKDEITALQIFYDQPYRLREITEKMVREVLKRLKADQPSLGPTRVWDAYRQVEQNAPATPRQELVALVSLLRRIVGLDERLTDFSALVRQRFQDWVFKRHSGSGEKFTAEQMEWLQMLRDHIATSFQVTTDDLELSPFDARGGLGRFYQLFGQDYEAILAELNERLVA
ncbi:MAG: DEAD/DEAH box helicase family protein [Planctomycetota bacterium]